MNIKPIIILSLKLYTSSWPVAWSDRLRLVMLTIAGDFSVAIRGLIRRPTSSILPDAK